MELQWEFLRWRRSTPTRPASSSAAATRSAARCSRVGKPCSARSRRDPLALDGQLDWVTKWSLLDAYVDRDGLEWNDPKLSLLDLQYHDVRPDRSLYERLVRAGKVERLVTEAEVIEAMTVPPATTRAYFRGECLARWPDAVVAANWDSVILDVGSDPLRRIPMMEPLRGTKAHVAPLFAEVASPGELVARLQE